MNATGSIDITEAVPEDDADCDTFPGYCATDMSARLSVDVELTDDLGNALEIAIGKTVTVRWIE